MVGQNENMINHCLHLWKHTCTNKLQDIRNKLWLCKLGLDTGIKMSCLSFHGRRHFVIIQYPLKTILFLTYIFGLKEAYKRSQHSLTGEQLNLLYSISCAQIMKKLKLPDSLGKGPKLKMSQKVEKVQKGGWVSAANQKVHNSKCGLFDKRRRPYFQGFPKRKCRH